MSADNWEICPRCLFRARREAQDAYDKVMATYGQVPLDEFDAARAELKPVEDEDYRTLREDYEFYGADEGTVRADYRCGCTVCGLSGSLKASEEFWTETDA
jgi:hypothetical protein